MMLGGIPTSVLKGLRHLITNIACDRDCPNIMAIWKFFCAAYPNNFCMQDCQTWFSYHPTIEVVLCS